MYHFSLFSAVVGIDDLVFLTLSFYHGLQGRRQNQRLRNIGNKRVRETTGLFCFCFERYTTSEAVFTPSEVE